MGRKRLCVAYFRLGIFCVILSSRVARMVRGPCHWYHWLQNPPHGHIFRSRVCPSKEAFVAKCILPLDVQGYVAGSFRPVINGQNWQERLSLVGSNSCPSHYPHHDKNCRFLRQSIPHLQGSVFRIRMQASDLITLNADYLLDTYVNIVCNVPAAVLFALIIVSCTVHRQANGTFLFISFTKNLQEPSNTRFFVSLPLTSSQFCPALSCTSPSS